MKTKFIASVLIVQIFCCQFVFAQQRGGGNVKVKTSDGQTKEIKLYDGSFALVIGNSSYQNWDNLPGVKSDVEAVKKSLEANGFTVETSADLTSREMPARIEQFISDYGYEKNNRLLIYYAGHGHTQRAADEADDREIGYIVPVDAPLPNKDALGFLRKAVNLEKIRTFAKEIQAKHAIFLFDSCFSGKLVSRSNVTFPPIIQESVTYPVRQFITAGAANQEVPDESIFRRSFTRALEGEADLNKDGFILGTELASFLREQVANYSRRAQTPQYGKIDDIALDRGDFVFTVTSKKTTAPDKIEPSKPDTPIIARSRGEIEREAWSYIKDGTDAQDFRDFLKEFPDGANAGNAKIKLEQAVWDAVKESKDKARIQSYLNEFPTGINEPLARIRLRQLNSSVNSTLNKPANSKNCESDTIQAKNSLYEKFTLNFKGATDQRKIAMEAGKQFIEKYGACEDSEQIVSYLKANIPVLENYIAEVDKGFFYKKFDIALKTGNTSDIFSSGKDIIEREPNFLDVFLVLSSVGFDQASATPPNDNYNDDSVAYSKMAIQKLEENKSSKTGNYGVLQYAYKNKENGDGKSNALNWMNYNIGYIMYYRQGKNNPAKKKEALPYFYKATQYTSTNQKNPTPYQAIGAWYLDEAIRIDNERVAVLLVNGNKDNEQTLAMVGEQKGYADRAIDAYSRAYKLAKTAPRPNKAYTDNLYAKLTELYKFRYDGKIEEIDEFVERIFNIPFPNPSSEVLPVKY